MLALKRIVVLTTALVAVQAQTPAEQDQTERIANLGLSAIQLEDVIQLAWLPASTSVRGYHVYRKQSGDWQRITSEPFPFHSYVDIAPAFDSVEISYAVVAVNDDGSEGTPNEVNITFTGPGQTTNKGTLNRRVSSQSYWDQNNIVTNADFTDQSRMSVDAIQRFLAAHGTILATFSQGGKTAAQIIYEAATSEEPKINPQILLAMIQKESSLITLRALPANVSADQKTSVAMGIGPASTFTLQVNLGACILRAGFTAPRSCSTAKVATVGQPYAIKDGPKSITPQNAATASLYRYNPYIGNQVPGGDPGVAGNSMFWRVWYDMFYFSDAPPSLFSLYLPSSPLGPQSGVQFEWNVSGSNFDSNAKVFISGQKNCPAETCLVSEGDISYKSASSVRGRATLGDGNYGIFVENGVKTSNSGGVPSAELKLSVNKPSYGSVYINATAKGGEWKGNVACLLKGPISLQLTSVPVMLPNIIPIGSYTLTCSPNAVGPATGTTPSPTQQLNAGGSVYFTVNFGETLSTPILSGPTVGLAGALYTFTSSSVISNIGSAVSYEFDWGDGTNSSSNTPSSAHVYFGAGRFSVRVKAKSKRDSSVVSTFSNSLAIQTFTPVAGSCSVSPNPVKVNKTATWSASPTGGSGSYGFVWSTGFTDQSYLKSYASVQTVSNYTVTITDRQTGSSVKKSCPSLSVTK